MAATQGEYGAETEAQQRVAVMQPGSFVMVKLQKLDALIRSLADRSAQLEAVPVHDATHKQIIQLEQDVCNSIAQDLARLMQRESASATPKAPAPAQGGANGMAPKRLPSASTGRPGPQQPTEGMSKAKMEREKQKQNPAYREKERARKQANMDRKIAERKAREAAGQQ